jgi:hypothetical protein
MACCLFDVNSSFLEVEGGNREGMVEANAELVTGKTER